MFIPDLKEFPSGRHPAGYGVLALIRRGKELGYGRLPAGTVLHAVGWLGNQVPSSGDTPEECIDGLVLAYEGKRGLSDGTMGSHTCEICTTQEQRYPGGKSGPVIHWRGRDLRLHGHGHYLVRRRDVVYIAPLLLLHYILDHHYRPPEEFVEAVIMGSFLTSEDLLFVPPRIMPRPGADEGWTQASHGRAPEEMVSVPSGIVHGRDAHGSGMTQGRLDGLLRWGIVFSIFWLAGAGSLFALLAGLRAKKEIAQSGGELEGWGRAQWCIVAGTIGLVWWLPFLIIAIVNQFQGRT